MRVGLVCPYTWDVPGGVQAHVRDLAARLVARGHVVSVLTPVDDPDAADLPAWVVPAGRAVPVPYNGSVARLVFGPVSLARTRRWLREGAFDVVHVHEPTVPSVSMLACFAAQGPLVATFHTATTRSRALQVFGTALQPALEKVSGRIAVSPAARRVVVEHLGGDALLVPNGVEVAHFQGAPPWDGPLGDRSVPTVVFLGRIDEPRKGLAVLLEALPELVRQVPDVRLLVGGPGDVDAVRATVPPQLRGHVHLLGLVDEADKPGLYASGHVYCAPHTHGESFGIVLVEALATGTPVVASDLEAFRRVLDDGRCGALFPVGDADALATTLAAVLGSPETQRDLSAAGSSHVRRFDWGTVVGTVEAVYDTVRAAAPVDLDSDLGALVDLADTSPDDEDDSDLTRLLAGLREWVGRRRLLVGRGEDGGRR